MEDKKLYNVRFTQFYEYLDIEAEDEDEAPYYRCSNCGNISSNGTEETCESCGVEMVEFEL